MNALNTILLGLFAMGLRLTRGIETPKFTSLGTINPPDQVSFQIRDYAQSVAVETCGQNNAFMYLAGYIGVLSTPANSRREKIAMTAPVVNYPKDNKMCMQFILPQSVYGGDVSSAPTPSYKQVELLERPQMVMAYLSFYGWTNMRRYSMKLTQLYNSLKEMEKSESFEWVVKEPMHLEAYGYSGPGTPTQWRKNGVAIQLERKN